MADADGWLPCYPEFPNVTCWKPQPTAKLWLFEIIVYSTSVLTVVLNLFIIISVSHFRQLHTPTNILLLSLAVSDFLTGLVLMPLDIKQLFHCWVFNILECALFKVGFCILTTVSIGNMVLISVDRYLAICDPLHYTTRVTVKRANVTVCLLWLYSLVFYTRAFLFHIIQLLNDPACIGACLSFSTTFGVRFQLVLNMILPITVIVVLYMRVFIVAVSQAHAMRSHVTAVTKQISGTRTAKKSELKAARTLGVLVVVFLICIMPTYVAGLYFGELSLQFMLFNTFAIHFNSCLNPVIYALFYSWFRKAVKLIVTLQILQPGSCEANIM